MLNVKVFGQLLRDFFQSLTGLEFRAQEKRISDSFRIEGNAIVVTVFLLILNQTEFRSVHNQEETRHYDHIPFNLKRIRNLFLYIYSCICYSESAEPVIPRNL